MKKLLTISFFLTFFCNNMFFATTADQQQGKTRENQIKSFIPLLDNPVPAEQIDLMFRLMNGNSLRFAEYCALEEEQKAQIFHIFVKQYNEHYFDDVLFDTIDLPVSIKKLLFLTVLKIGTTDTVCYKDLIKYLFINAIVQSNSDITVFSCNVLPEDAKAILLLGNQAVVQSLFTARDKIKHACLVVIFFVSMIPDWLVQSGFLKNN